MSSYYTERLRNANLSTSLKARSKTCIPSSLKDRMFWDGSLVRREYFRQGVLQALCDSSPSACQTDGCKWQAPPFRYDLFPHPRSARGYVWSLCRTALFQLAHAVTLTRSHLLPPGGDEQIPSPVPTTFDAPRQAFNDSAGSPAIGLFAFILRFLLIPWLVELCYHRIKLLFFLRIR